MKKTITLFLLTLLFNRSGAQITLTQADMPQAGRFYILSSSSALNGADTSTGTSKTWDFSTINYSGQNLDSFYSKSSMPFAYQFLFISSNLGQKISNISFGTFSLTNSFNIFRTSSSKFEQTASIGELNGAPVPVYYSPADVWYNLPLHYGDTATSVSAYSVSLPSLFTFIQHRVRKTEVDGWGTLKLPMGSFDVLRVKSVLYDQDSITAFGFTTPVNNVTMQYRFIGQDHGDPLLEIDANALLGTPQVTSITYQDTLHATGVANIFAPSYQSFPNPASNYITVITDDGSWLFITDIMGRVILTLPLENKRTTVNISSVPAGMYFISVKNSSGERITQKLIVQH